MGWRRRSNTKTFAVSQSKIKHTGSTLPQQNHTCSQRSSNTQTFAVSQSRVRHTEFHPSLPADCQAHATARERAYTPEDESILLQEHPYVLARQLQDFHLPRLLVDSEAHCTSWIVSDKGFSQTDHNLSHDLVIAPTDWVLGVHDERVLHRNTRASLTVEDSDVKNSTLGMHQA